MNFLGLDLKPLTTEITKFRQDQQEIVALLKLILIQLGGQPPKDS